MRRTILGLCIAAFASTAGADEIQRLREVRVRATGAGAVVEVIGTRPPTFTAASAPGVLAIEFPGAQWEEPPIAPGAGPVFRVRGENEGRFARLLLEMDAGAEARMTADGAVLRMEIAPGIGARPIAVASRDPEAPGRAAAAPVRAKDRGAAHAQADARKARAQAALAAPVAREQQGGGRIARAASDPAQSADAERWSAERPATSGARALAAAEPTAGREGERWDAQRRDAGAAHAETEPDVQGDWHRRGDRGAAGAALAEADPAGDGRAMRRDAHAARSTSARAHAKRTNHDEVAHRMALRHADSDARADPAARIARLDRPAHARADAAATDGRQSLTYLGFQPAEEGARVILRTANPPAYRIEQRRDRLVVILDRARIPLANNRRAIDASFFGTAVGRIHPIEDLQRDEVRVEIALRRPAPRWEVHTDGAELAIEFGE